MTAEVNAGNVHHGLTVADSFPMLNSGRSDDNR